jgi:hypothetical protein
VTVSQKAALSLLISVFLFAGFAVLANTGLFDLVETRFYSPSITRSLTRDIEQNAGALQAYFAELEGRFSETLNETAVRRSFLPNQSAEDIFERSRVYRMLLETVRGLQSVRFIDAGGIRIHYSTWIQDILREDRLSVAYRNYNDNSSNVPYNQVEVGDQGKLKITLDDRNDRIIFSFPFHDTYEVYRGTVLFTISVRAVADRLINEGKIRISDDVSILPNPPGIVLGLLGSEKDIILPMVSSIWNEGILTLSPLDSFSSSTTLALISSKTSQGIFVGCLINEDLFAFPQNMKVILLLSFFLTIYLTIFLFFNLRQDAMTIVQNRLKNLQISLIEQYYEHKSDMDWNHWSREMEQRREEIRAEVKRGIKFNKGKRADDDIDALIDKSWDELLTVIGGRNNSSGIDEEKLQAILNKVLKPVSAATVPAAGSETPRAAPVISPVTASEAVDEAEEIEEIGEPEEVEELEEVEAADEPSVTEELSVTDEPSAVAENKAAAAPVSRIPSSGKKSSNIRLAFGDDDIPYVVETSGLELVDENADAVLSVMHPDDEPADLEELDEVEDLEEAAEAADTSPSPMSDEDNLAEIARQIEFSPLPESDDADDNNDSMDDNLDVVSPFATVLSDLNSADRKKKRTASASSGKKSSPDNSGDKKKTGRSKRRRY